MYQVQSHKFIKPLIGRLGVMLITTGIDCYSSPCMCRTAQNLVMFTFFIVVYSSVKLLIVPAFYYFCQALLYHVYSYVSLH